jgi:hypothetical protein
VAAPGPGTAIPARTATRPSPAGATRPPAPPGSPPPEPSAPRRTPSPAPLAITDTRTVNGIPSSEFVLLPAEVQENVRQIFARGQQLGRNANAFSKLGDSLIATPGFLTLFDNGPYDLGPYADLQPVVDHYAGSFERYGVAIHAGLHSWGVFDPFWAPDEWCGPNEDIVACEFRLNNPSVLLVLLGTNDSGSPGNFEYNVRKVVETSIEQAVIPVLVTKADRFEGPDGINNTIIREIAEDLEVPLWDYDKLADTMPNRGLDTDQVHLSVFVEGDYNLRLAYETGHGVHNLTALMILEAVLQATGQLEE